MRRRLLGSVLGGLGALLLALALSGGPAHAQSGAYQLGWWGMGGSSSAGAGSYSLQGVIGQAYSGSVSGGEYHLQSGSVAGAPAPEFQLYLPILAR